MNTRPTRQTVLVVAAHPDDELLGLGGTLRRHALAGDEVHLLVLCEGVTMRYEGRDVPQRDHGDRAAEILGAASIEMLGLRDQHLDMMSLVDIITPIEERLRRHRPRIVYTHYGADLNRDHQLVQQATLVACRPVAESPVQELYFYETPSSTEWAVPMVFSPDYFVDVSATLDDKLAAFACYESEVCAHPHPRSMDHLRHRARYWGNLVGVDFAEAFVTGRRLWR